MPGSVLAPGDSAVGRSLGFNSSDGGFMEQPAPMKLPPQSSWARFKQSESNCRKYRNGLAAHSVPGGRREENIFLFLIPSAGVGIFFMGHVSTKMILSQQTWGLFLLLPTNNWRLLNWWG